MKPSTPTETAEQKQQRLIAERENRTSMQEYLQGQTKVYQKLRSPRVSIATGKSAGQSLV
jgi:hypothetical protein